MFEGIATWVLVGWALNLLTVAISHVVGASDEEKEEYSIWITVIAQAIILLISLVPYATVVLFTLLMLVKRNVDWSKVLNIGFFVFTLLGGLFLLIHSIF